MNDQNKVSEACVSEEPPAGFGVLNQFVRVIKPEERKNISIELKIDALTDSVVMLFGIAVTDVAFDPDGAEILANDLLKKVAEARRQRQEFQKRSS